ncbi:MAG TPA: hypothetical protein VGM13_16160 [Thermoanaerobaculia bacterium]|jgi:hypothetical protein
MRILRSAFLTAALTLVLASGVARAQAIPFDIEAGYRFLSVTGNEEMYRSQINDREGFLIRSLHIGTDEKYAGFPLTDKFRLDAADLGAGGAGFLRLDAGLSGVYRLRFSYRNSQYFSAIQGFANPLGATVGQQTWDRTRQQFNVDLEVLPGKVITPLVGYTSNTLSGPGYSTYHFGQDEFQLSQNLRSNDQEFRVGAAFSAGIVSGEVIQGWRKYHETEDLTLAPFGGPGNNTTPVLGKTVTANSLTRSSTTDVNVPVTSAFVRGFALPNLQISGFYVRSNATGDDGTREGASGSFASFAISRFFTGYSANNTTSPNSLTWRAGGRAEWHVLSGLDLSAGYTERDQTWDNQALINELYTGTSTFTGFSQADVTSLLSTQTNIERKEKLLDVQASMRFLGPVGIRLGFSRIDQDLTVVEDPAEIVVPGNQGGTFSRSINRYEGALTFTMAGFNIMGEASYDDANAAITRVDYLKRNRERVRLTWKTFDWIQLGGAAMWLDQKNEDSGPLNAYTASSTNYSVDLTLKPVKDVWLRGAYGQLKADSSIPVRAPQNFTVFNSVNTEDGELMDFGAGFKFKGFAVDGFWSRFDNTGSYLFRMYRGGARADWTASAHAGLVVEWTVDRYLDLMQSSQSFRGDRLGVYLRWRP